jgi:hypothetical protein
LSAQFAKSWRPESSGLRRTEFIMTNTDNIAFWLSGGSLLVAFASLVVALMAKKQARQAALLMSRTEAIAHLRQALADLNRNGLATAKTVDSIQKAVDLSHSAKRSGKTSSRHTFLHDSCNRART